MTRFPTLPAEDHDAAQIRMAERAGRTGPYEAFLRAPGLWEALQHVRLYLSGESLLDARLRELCIVAIARHWRCTAAFAGHVALARKAGLPDHIVVAIGAGQPPRDLHERETISLSCVAALLREGGIDDALHARAQAHIGDRALVELVGLVGFFTTICLTLNLAGIAGDAPFGPAPGTYSPSGQSSDD